MSIELSAESIFVARNWETIEELFEATQRLRDEMQQMLLSLEADLEARSWWSDGWVFIDRGPGGIGISREAWRSGDEHLLRINVSRFGPENVFGLADLPYLYVYVTGRRQALRDALMATLDEEQVLGEIGKGGGWFIVAQETVARCLPDGVEAYLPQARDRIIAFLEHYAGMADVWDPIVRKHKRARSAK